MQNRFVPFFNMILNGQTLAFKTGKFEVWAFFNDVLSFIFQTQALNLNHLLKHEGMGSEFLHIENSNCRIAAHDDDYEQISEHARLSLQKINEAHNVRLNESSQDNRADAPEQ